MGFTFTPDKTLKGVLIVEGSQYADDRGFFCETFRIKEFQDHGIGGFVQENYSRSKPPCFRGMHYQLEPHAQGKLVYCISGMIMDYVLDIRQGSPTYGKSTRIELNSNDGLKAVWVPPGFAHGFYAVEEKGVNLLYKVTDYYYPDLDRSIRWNDPDLYIGVPAGANISDKDANAPLLKDAENNFYY